MNLLILYLIFFFSDSSSTCFELKCEVFSFHCTYEFSVVFKASSLSERTDGQPCQPLRQRMCSSRHEHKRQNGMRSQAEQGQRE